MPRCGGWPTNSSRCRRLVGTRPGNWLVTAPAARRRARRAQPAATPPGHGRDGIRGRWAGCPGAGRPSGKSRRHPLPYSRSAAAGPAAVRRCRVRPVRGRVSRPARRRQRRGPGRSRCPDTRTVSVARCTSWKAGGWASPRRADNAARSRASNASPPSASRARRARGTRRSWWGRGVSSRRHPGSRVQPGDTQEGGDEGFQRPGLHRCA